MEFEVNKIQKMFDNLRDLSQEAKTLYEIDDVDEIVIINMLMALKRTGLPDKRQIRVAKAVAFISERCEEIFSEAFPNSKPRE